jgi:uncharacterized repeat protein (TIGR04042 family)
MPELRVRVRCGPLRPCYSPLRAVTEFLVACALEDFVGRSRAALELASERVRRRYGFACTSAAARLEEIERAASAFEPAAARS